MQAFKLLSSIASPPHFQKFLSNPEKPFLSLFSSLSSLTEPQTQIQIQIPIPNPNFAITNYLINTFKFSKTQAITISTRLSSLKNPQNPQSVLLFLRSLGLSETQIRSAVRVSPQILYSDVNKILKPKIQFFQELGLVGSDLGKFIAKHSMVLTNSLERKLVPCVEIIKKSLSDDQNNQNLIRILRRCNRVLTVDPESRLSGNIAFLKSCGIVGSQLSMLLTRQPRLLAVQESKLRDLVARVLDMGFSVNSRMLVHAIYIVSCMSNETFMRKLDLIQSFGFSSDECMEMFRKAPAFLGASEEKLKFGIEFFMNTIKFEKSVLIRRPSCLMFSMVERVVPRYMVLQVLMSKRLLKKEPSFMNTLDLTEEEFLDKYISNFRDNAEELLVVYKGHLLDSSSGEES